MSTPSNLKLYEKVKKEIFKKNPVNSAYRSGLLVKTYQERGGTYKGKKDESKGLSRWYKESWSTQSGSTTYKKKSDVFRPTVRVNKETPKTFKELSKKEIEKAQKEKKQKGRVKKF